MRVSSLCLVFLSLWTLDVYAGAIRIDSKAPDLFAVFSASGATPTLRNLILAHDFGPREPCCFRRREEWVEILIARNRRIPPAAEAASAVPEPGSAALLTFGLLGFLAYKSKKSALTDALSKL